MSDLSEISLKTSKLVDKRLAHQIEFSSFFNCFNNGYLVNLIDSSISN